MKTLSEKIEEIIDEYASFVDDDSTYFVKPEEKKKYIDALLQAVKEEIPKKKKIMEKPYVQLEDAKRIIFEIHGWNAFRTELLSRIGKGR